ESGRVRMNGLFSGVPQHIAQRHDGLVDLVAVVLPIRDVVDLELDAGAACVAGGGGHIGDGGAAAHIPQRGAGGDAVLLELVRAGHHGHAHGEHLLPLRVGGGRGAVVAVDHAVAIGVLAVHGLDVDDLRIELLADRLAGAG